MFHKFLQNAVVVPLFALVAALTLACPAAEAQVKPFKVTGGGNGPEGLSVIGGVSPYTMTGQATHLGEYSGFGIAQVTGEGTFTGGFVFVAADGDRLVCEHPGTFAVYPDGQGELFAVFDAIFTPTSLTVDGTVYTSTGRREILREQQTQRNRREAFLMIYVQWFVFFVVHDLRHTVSVSASTLTRTLPVRSCCMRPFFCC